MPISGAALRREHGVRALWLVVLAGSATACGQAKTPPLPAGAPRSPVALNPPGSVVVPPNRIRGGVVSALPPDTVSAIVNDDAQYVQLPNAKPGWMVHRSVLSIQFEDSVSQPTRAALIASIGGVVVGGEPVGDRRDGPYFVQVADDPTGEQNLLLGARLDSLPIVIAAYALSRLPTEDMFADPDAASRAPKGGVPRHDPAKENSHRTSNVGTRTSH